MAWFSLSVQLINELVALQKLGRCLCFPMNAPVTICITQKVQYRTANGAVREQAVSLLFPGTARTIARVVDAYWVLKVRPLAIHTIAGSNGYLNPWVSSRVVA
jgi:hypothetical protein